MRIACITDLHGRLAALGRILADAGPVDAVLLGGDITNFGSPIDVDRVIELARAKVSTVLAVAGNCDSAAIDRRLVELGVSLHGRGVLLGPIGFYGLSATPPWKKGMYQLTEDDLAAALEAGHAQVCQAAQHVLLAHVPPHKTRLDRTLFWSHAGSTALRAFIEQAQPALVLCGHIHEARGTDRLGATAAVNCGYGARGAYVIAEVDQQVRVELRSA
jgi:Icc-related predicted phosphoesterase